LRAMNQSGLYISGRRRPHHEAAVRCLIQTNTCVGLVHVSYDLFGIEQNNQVLGQESETVDDQVLLRKPDRAALGYAETRTNHAHIYIREFVWIPNVFRAPCTRNLRNSRANHLCRWMERGQSRLRLGWVPDVVCRAAGFLKVFFESGLEVRVGPPEDRNLRMLHLPSWNVGANG